MAASQTFLSIVIPAYQEAQRIGPTLEELVGYLRRRGAKDCEIIVVSGGSTDDTVEIALKFSSELGEQLKVIDLPRARGKGAAVRAGMREASGKFILFTDADLAYEPALFDGFIARLQAGADLVIAQRTSSTEYASRGRRWIARTSRSIFERFITPGIGDTQAGLKAFTHAAAKDLFSRQVVNGLIFDVELLILARQRKYRIEKAFVDWQDKPGSTIRLGRDSARAVFDLMRVFWRIGTGQCS
jgi:glycosyltransferase involved in cell wall biosynthesis